MVRRARVIVPSPARPDDVPRDAIVPVGMEFGGFPEITRLNPGFVAGRERVKITLDVFPPCGALSVTAARLVGPLEALLPGLARHRCCGDRLLVTSLRRGDGHTCALREADDAVDLAHLFEHVAIDFTHGVADMRRCSGVTCGYENPRYRCDVFVESPGRAISRLCVRLALALMNDLLRGEAPDSLYPVIVKVARHFLRHPFAPISGPGACDALGQAARMDEALAALWSAGFIAQIPTSMNFSGAPIFRLDDRRH